jgi:hypothetical protein
MNLPSRNNSGSKPFPDRLRVNSIPIRCATRG